MTTLRSPGGIPSVAQLSVCGSRTECSLGETTSHHEAVKIKERYDWTRSLISALDPSNGKVHKVWEDGHQDRSAGILNISSPLGFDHRTVQSVASRYTD